MADHTREQLLQALRDSQPDGKKPDKPLAQALARKLDRMRTTAANPPRPADFAKRFGEGAIAHAADLGQTLLKPVGWVSDTAKDYLGRSQRISNEMKAEAGLPGALGGTAVDIAGTAGIGGIVRGGLAKATTMFPKAAAVTSAPITAATIEGAAGGMYQSPQSPGAGAGIGAVGGGAGQQILSRTLGRVAKPIDLEKYSDTKALIDEGVPLTIGQGANPNTVTGRGLRMAEETLSAIPLVGGSIRNQREAARQAWRDVPLRNIARDAGVPEPSRAGFASHSDMQEQVRDAIGLKYDALLAGKSVRPTGVLKRNLDDIVENPKLSMTPADRKRVRDLVEAHIYGRQIDYSLATPAAPPTMQAKDIFKSQSDLRMLGHKAMQSDLSSEQAYGRALVDSADEIYNFIARRHPNIGQQLQDLRGPYSELSTLRGAAEKAGVRGEFTPTDLGKRAIATGNDPLKHWSAMAEPLLTKDPGGISSLARLSLLTGGGMLIGPGSIPVAATAMLGFGTKTGQLGLQGKLGWQKRLSDILANNPDEVNSMSTIAGRESGIGLVDPEKFRR